MKIFTSDNGSFDEKVNFVDENNRFVGYDLGQSCCEYADWAIFTVKDMFLDINKIEEIEYTGSSDIIKSGKEIDVTDYVFDPNFYDESQLSEEWGGRVIFRLVCPNKQDLYLHLFNVHNGYYAHNFETNISDGGGGI